MSIAWGEPDATKIESYCKNRFGLEDQSVQTYLRYLQTALQQPALSGNSTAQGFLGYNVNSKRLKTSLGNIRAGITAKPANEQQTSLEHHGFVATNTDSKPMNRGLAVMMKKLEEIEYKRKRRELEDLPEDNKRVKHSL